MRILRAASFIILALMLSLLTAGCSRSTNQQPDDTENVSDTDTESVSDTDTDKASSLDNDQSSEKSALNESTDSESKTADSSTAVERPEIRLITDQGVPSFDNSYLTEEMLLNAVPATGDITRLLSVMQRARNKEEITIGVIGGSITQGSLATSSDKSYAALFYKWWLEAFPETKINFVNAGIGATNSYLGVHRVDNDLLDKEPDVIVVEFSVNDSDTLFYKQSYESLIRKILNADNNPAVILLFMTMEDGTSVQPSHMHIGFWYDLPRLSYRDAVLKEIEKGTFTWKDISPDNIHPNDKGHQIAGEILWGYLNMVYKELEARAQDEIIEASPIDKKPLLDDSYSQAAIYDSTVIEPIQYGSFEKKDIQYVIKHSWTVTEGDEPIIFETEAQNIGILFYKTIIGDGGQFEVYVDGKHVRTIDAHFERGWGNYAEAVEVYSSHEKQSHTIEIRKSKNSTGNVLNLLGLLIS
jgi:lysophospholipase L1-like esterase